MNDSQLELLMNLYNDCVAGKRKLDSNDKDNLFLFLIETFLPDNNKYEIYLDNIKNEARRIFNKFENWYNNSGHTFKEYNTFYDAELKNEFKCKVFGLIYDFFNPAMVQWNFCYLKNGTDVIINNAIISYALENYLYNNMLHKEQVNGIDWKEEYIPNIKKIENIKIIGLDKYGEPYILNDFREKREYQEKKRMLWKYK